MENRSVRGNSNWMFFVHAEALHCGNGSGTASAHDVAVDEDDRRGMDAKSVCVKRNIKESKCLFSRMHESSSLLMCAKALSRCFSFCLPFVSCQLAFHTYHECECVCRTSYHRHRLCVLFIIIILVYFRCVILFETFLRLCAPLT